jgi:hypothetical protein
MWKSAATMCWRVVYIVQRSRYYVEDGVDPVEEGLHIVDGGGLIVTAVQHIVTSVFPPRNASRAGDIVPP